MPTTASPTLAALVHDRIVSGAERGIRYRPTASGQARYQVRVYPAPAENHDEPLAAITRRDELAASRAAGAPLPRPRRHSDPTLAEACASFLAEQDAAHAAGRSRASTPRYYRENTRVWRTDAHDPDDQPQHVRPFALQRLSQLDPLAIGRYLRRVRVVAAPVAARHDRQALIKVLDLAELNGARVDPALRRIALPPRPRRDDRRRRTILRPDELALLVEYAPAYAGRMLHLAALTGMRLNELTGLTADRVDLDAATIFVPAELCKEGRDKTIPLLPAEVRLVREQLLVRAPRAPLVFPRKGGTPFATRSGFYRLVLTPALRGAAAAWQDEHGLDRDAPTPFDGFQFKWLRRTAIALMRQAGLEPEIIARRVGHADVGDLVLTVYREIDADVELRAALDGLGDSLLDAVASRRA